MKTYVSIILLFLVVSCGAPKSVVSTKETQESKNVLLTSQSALNTQIETIVKKVMDEKIDEFTVTNIRQEKEVYSCPDSLGNQHIAEKTTTFINAQKKTSVNTELQEDMQQVVDSHFENKDDVELNTQIAESSTFKEAAGIPWWKKALMWVGIMAIALVIMKIILKVWI